MSKSFAIPVSSSIARDVHLCIMVYILWIRSRNCGRLATRPCYQLITKPGNKTATVTRSDPYSDFKCNNKRLFMINEPIVERNIVPAASQFFRSLIWNEWYMNLPNQFKILTSSLLNTMVITLVRLSSLEHNNVNFHDYPIFNIIYSMYGYFQFIHKIMLTILHQRRFWHVRQLLPVFSYFSHGMDIHVDWGKFNLYINQNAMSNYPMKLFLPKQRILAGHNWDSHSMSHIYERQRNWVISNFWMFNVFSTVSQMYSISLITICLHYNAKPMMCSHLVLSNQ